MCDENSDKILLTTDCETSRLFGFPFLILPSVYSQSQIPFKNSISIICVRCTFLNYIAIKESLLHFTQFHKNTED